MERYVNAAILQRMRLDEDGRLLAELLHRGPTRLEVIETMGRAFADVHFFLICGDKVHGLFEYIVAMEHNRDMRTVWRKKRLKLEAFRDARDVLEHMDERVKLGELNSGGMLVNGVTFSIGDKVIDVGPKALVGLTGAYEELCAAASSLPIRSTEKAASEAGGPSITSPPITITPPATNS